jgi:hypothetical protein
MRLDDQKFKSRGGTTRYVHVLDLDSGYLAVRPMLAMQHILIYNHVLNAESLAQLR